MTYNPQEMLYKGIQLAIPLQLLPWDDYFARMAEADFLNGKSEQIAVKSFVMRKAPFGGSYALLGGITEALRTITELRFDTPDFQRAMEDLKYNARFISELAHRKKLNVQVFAPPEGMLFAAQEPIVSVRGPLLDIRLVEGIITEAVNRGTLSLTKWHRLIQACEPGSIMDFSRRRSQCHLFSSLYAMLAGCSATSDSELRRFFDVRVIGTMGHEYIQSYGSPAAAFDAWLTVEPDRPIGLVDTVQVMEVDFPAWLDAVYKHRDAIKASAKFWGWRNDSGDLAYLTLAQYKMFLGHRLGRDPWFVKNLTIVLTNDLDEYVITDIKRQILEQASSMGVDGNRVSACILWAAGTKPGTCYDQPSLGGVMKLQEISRLACIKLAMDPQGLPGIKTSIPGFNRSAKVFDPSGKFVAVLIYPERMYAIKMGLLFEVKNGREVNPLIAVHADTPGAEIRLTKYHLVSQQEMVYDTVNATGFTYQAFSQSITDVSERIKRELALLDWSQKRLENPHTIKVSVTPDLRNLRQQMITKKVLREDGLH